MGIIKRFGKKNIEEKPRIYDEEFSEKTVDCKPIEEIDEKVVDTFLAKRDNEIDDALRKQDDYLTKMIYAAEHEINRSEEELDTIRKNLVESRRRIIVLNAIKDENMVFQVKWLLNRIGELKGTPDPLKKIESEIYSFIEEEMKK